VRILFYLPVVTPWWFDAIVAPLIRAASRGADVTVMVPPLWRNTGVGAEQLKSCEDVEGVVWHILDHPDSAALRRAGATPHLIDIVQELSPDLTICRSADLEAIEHFPGPVRFLMEAAAPPFVTEPARVWLSTSLFNHGFLPPLSPERRAVLDAAIEPLWAERDAVFDQIEGEEFLHSVGLDPGKKRIVVPLDYEHPECFFDQHNILPDNVALINELAGRLGDDFQLAVANHPMNELHGDTLQLQEAIARHGDKVRLIVQAGTPDLISALLTKHCDGMIVGNSTNFALAAFFGKPLLRLSHFRSAPWLETYDRSEDFFNALRNGRAIGPRANEARLWFAHHLFQLSFDPGESGLTADHLIARIDDPDEAVRWRAIGQAA